MVSLINLFFVPCIGLYVMYRRRGEALCYSPRLLLRYAIFTVCNLPLTQAVLVLIRHLARYEIPTDAVYYTVIASATSFLTPYLWAFFRRYIRLRLRAGEKS